MMMKKLKALGAMMFVSGCVLTGGGLYWDYSGYIDYYFTWSQPLVLESTYCDSIFGCSKLYCYDNSAFTFYGHIEECVSPEPDTLVENTSWTTKYGATCEVWDAWGQYDEILVDLDFEPYSIGFGSCAYPEWVYRSSDFSAPGSDKVGSFQLRESTGETLAENTRINGKSLKDFLAGHAALVAEERAARTAPSEEAPQAGEAPRSFSGKPARFEVRDRKDAK